jgi:hypothetical protein
VFTDVWFRTIQFCHHGITVFLRRISKRYPDKDTYYTVYSGEKICAVPKR